MPSPAPLIIDDFNRSDENPLSDSGQWSQMYYDSGAQALTVASGVCAPVTPPSHCMMSRNSLGPDTEVCATVTGVPSGGNVAAGLYLFLRLTDPALSTWFGYFLHIKPHPSVRVINIVRADAWDSYAILLRDFPIPTVSVGDQFGFQAIGSTLIAWYKPVGGAWEVLTSVHDEIIPWPGYVGLGIASSVAGVTVDDFAARTVPLIAPLPVYLRA